MPVRRYRRRRGGRLVKGRTMLSLGKKKVGRRTFRYKRTNKGFISLYRKLPTMFLQNGIAAGTVNAVNDPTGSCMNVGTPLLEANNSTYAIPFAMKFRLSQIINYQDLTNLCDAYKLKYVSIKMQWLHNSSEPTGQTCNPTLMWIQDHDDAAPPSSVESIREKTGVRVKCFGPNRVFKIGVQPRCTGIVNSVGSPAAAVAPPTWLNTAFPSVDHFAIKGVITNVSLPSANFALQQFNWDVSVLTYGKDFQ